MASMIVGEMREGQGSVKKGSGVTLTYSSTYNFLVVTDDKYTDRETVLFNTPGLPIVGVVYGYIQAVCTGIDAKRRKEEPTYWDVTCTFETGKEEQQQSPSDPESPDPLTWLPVFSVDSFETRDKVLKTDKSPTPKKCVNSAGTPFSDPLTITETICSFSFTQFESASQTLKSIMARNGCINKEGFTVGIDSYAARTLKINVTKAEKGYFMGATAWRIEYRVTYDPDTWDEDRLDVGPVCISGGKRIACMDEERKFKIVGNLNGSGAQTYSEPSVLTFRTKTQLSFADFIRTS